MRPQRIEDWLRRAYETGKDCPLPETYLEESLDNLPDADRGRVLEHADRCPACAAERDLAREFDASQGETEADRGDLNFVVSRLRSPVGAEGVVVPLGTARARRSSYLTPYLGLAAAAALMIVAVGTFTLLRAPAPSLPTRTEDPVVRGGRVQIDGPVGVVDSVPRTLRWKVAPGAASYRVRFLKVDGTVLLEYTVRDTHLDLPDELLAQLHPAVAYQWEVEALDSGGVSITRSDRVEFRVRPGPE